MSVAFSDLARAAYCRRQLYYARRDDDRGPPPEVRARRRLAFRYPEVRDGGPVPEAVAVEPSVYRERIDRLAARDDWAALVAPAGRRVRLDGKDCHGVAHKVLAAPPRPSVVSPGAPPDRGVWRPQRVRAVATAKALAWERERPVERALVEYPAHGVVRTVELTTRTKAEYRRTLRAVRRTGGVPPRTDDRAKCGSCAYRERCGVRTRSLRSLLF
ncbi:MAG: Dna2/Cas4 domain-containing protein [Haloferacaceae archaeon]